MNQKNLKNNQKNENHTKNQRICKEMNDLVNMYQTDLKKNQTN